MDGPADEGIRMLTWGRSGEVAAWIWLSVVGRVYLGYRCMQPCQWHNRGFATCMVGWLQQLVPT